MKFPDMVHALKPNPKNHIQEGWRIADFFSHHPEALNMVRGGADRGVKRDKTRVGGRVLGPWQIYVL
jgi:catalase